MKRKKKVGSDFGLRWLRYTSEIRALVCVVCVFSNVTIYIKYNKKIKIIYPGPGSGYAG